MGLINICGFLNFPFSFFLVVMLLGVTLLKKKYPMAKYMCVLLIVAGVALFMYKPKKVVGMEEHTIGYGELLLVCVPGGKGGLFRSSSPRKTPPRRAKGPLQVSREVVVFLAPIFGLCLLLHDPGIC